VREDLAQLHQQTATVVGLQPGTGQVTRSGDAVFRIRIRFWIHRIHMFLGLMDPDPLVRGCSLLRAEGFSCSLGVLYGISKLQFLIKKI
jgi:hypothetical protein